jgi:hypothetical protein
MCTVPKDKLGPIQIDKIRPISLYEVVRKVWTGIVNARIMKVWEAQHTLCDDQYGYRETEVLQLINLVEDADEFHKEFFLMSFDTKKAFDSVNKNLMKAAWIRLGVPADIADYLTFLEHSPDGRIGKTAVKTPHANRVYHQVGHHAVLAEETSNRSAAAFTAVDGIGQGDSISATAWIALFDILLCMLKDNKQEPYIYQVDRTFSTYSDIFAYADVLNSISPSPQHLQEVVTIVSAFNTITGFSFNTKLECGTNSKRLTSTELVYYDHLWQPKPLAIQHKITIKILGVPIDLCNRWTDLEKYIRGKIELVTACVVKKDVSFMSKALAYQMAIVPTIIYPAKFLNRSVNEIKELLRPLDTFLRRISDSQRSFPRALLYGDESMGAYGLPDLALMVQKFKHAMIKRSFQSSSGAANAIQAMISRCYRQSVQPMDERLVHSEHHKSWLTSYTEQLAFSNLFLTPRQTFLHPPSINSLSLPECRDTVDWIAAQTEVETIADLQYIPSILKGQPEYATSHPLVPYLSLLPNVPVENTICIGRRYLTNTNNIYEFRGQLLPDRKQPVLLFREWKPRKPPIELHSELQLVASEHSLVQADTTLLSEFHSKVYCETKTNRAGYITRSFIGAILPDLPPVLPCSTTIPNQRIALPSDDHQLEIFTDAGI